MRSNLLKLLRRNCGLFRVFCIILEQVSLKLIISSIVNGITGAVEFFCNESRLITDFAAYYSVTFGDSYQTNMDGDQVYWQD